MGEEASNGTPPTAVITYPPNNHKYNHRHNATFTGTGTDSEETELTDESLVWSSNVDGQIGTGSPLVTGTLTPGAHTITLTATDSQSATGTDSINITITRGAGFLNDPKRFG